MHECVHVHVLPQHMTIVAAAGEQGRKGNVEGDIKQGGKWSRIRKPVIFYLSLKTHGLA